MDILFFVIQIIAVPAISPLLIGVIRKIKALMQNRVSELMSGSHIGISENSFRRMRLFRMKLHG
jgi:hypothetical protein